ncbi:alkene reductase [Chitinophaga arvensicola]|uniref:N-ethylmaleimide reductase n=1 Tax=Chitinophaga arvensicola TaxID=29529 RepID=A0A1I0RTV3_9BACT|nr:alkene reductase [Chitinophaga arvensicola]SEW44842.1 N-ethylmaleimide reductase [Chitinophaga arvensicola]
MKLLAPITIGDQTLKNRMVMAPMTRSRADSHGVVTPLTTLYYQQRASAGLIISEGLNISSQAIGLPFTPGIYTPEQIAGWKKVTTAVHEADGRIFAQLWHTGRAAHSANKNGELPVAPSAIAIAQQQVYTTGGWSSFETPEELSHAAIQQVIRDYRQATIHALEAGFDGVELHGAFGYLPNQFLSAGANNRTDEYGGSIENRSRFTLEVMMQLTDIAGPGKAGIKLSPSILYHGIADSDPVALYSYLLRELDKMPLAYIHLMQPMFPIDEFDRYPKDVTAAFGHLIHHPLIINAGYTRDTAEQILQEGKAQLVSFGALFLANPDLPERFRLNTALNEPDRERMYSGGDEKGYTDYPFLEN